MRSKLGPPAALVMVAMVALTSAGCLNGSAGDGNPDAGGSTGVAIGSSSGSSKNTTRHEKAVRFAECMRANGVREFPDPNASGEFV